MIDVPHHLARSLRHASVIALLPRTGEVRFGRKAETGRNKKKYGKHTQNESSLHNFEDSC